ncbi:hypothetical protein KXD40_005565 [Peronospora effusa]|uniref:Uncharacterized protein n=1 Tax=Peronospora effusa TaxID=542832 RepID=A0A3M6VD39_9STRA|nr:hypothetical protein DD238_006412 [Peronospora effusa]RQM13993.1 hypothetical protein DD237_006543 [Peronospora effusa]UIZ27551.1 hypothetical protein KXD40_005565 [Peronospora effusa]
MKQAPKSEFSAMECGELKYCLELQIYRKRIDQEIIMSQPACNKLLAEQLAWRTAQMCAHIG